VVWLSAVNGESAHGQVVAQDFQLVSVTDAPRIRSGAQVQGPRCARLLPKPGWYTALHYKQHYACYPARVLLLSQEWLQAPAFLQVSESDQALLVSYFPSAGCIGTLKSRC
jgi:hypothetical protein